MTTSANLFFPLCFVPPLVFPARFGWHFAEQRVHRHRTSACEVTHVSDLACLCCWCASLSIRLRLRSHAHVCSALANYPGDAFGGRTEPPIGGLPATDPSSSYAARITSGFEVRLFCQPSQFASSPNNIPKGAARSGRCGCLPQSDRLRRSARLQLWFLCTSAGPHPLASRLDCGVARTRYNVVSVFRKTHALRWRCCHTLYDSTAALLHLLLTLFLQASCRSMLDVSRDS